MLEQIASAPLTFWFAAIVFVLLTVEGLHSWNLPWAKPALAIYATVAVWYLGDYVLANEQDYHGFDPEVVQIGFVQVAAFLLILRALVNLLVPYFCRGLKQTSEVSIIPQRVVSKLLLALTALWLLLFLTAVFINGGEWLPLLWPPIQRIKLGMFVHPGVGSGIAFLFATAGYIHLLACGLFGTLFVLGHGRNRLLALCMVLLAWPYFWFNTVRNAMLATLLPGVAAYWIFHRHSHAIKVLVCLLMFSGVEIWFRQVNAFRGSGSADVQVFVEGLGTRNATTAKHYGLDMMKELCWINTFTQRGKFTPSWGQRYLAEALNFVPRSFWPGKPTIGLDYAKARGFADNRNAMGVAATIATGMIGQGIVNFGPYLGVAAAALLMAVWAAFLARCWCQRDQLPRLLLFLIGLGLTFNLGRDITLLVLFPFVFAYIGVRSLEYFKVDMHVRGVSSR
jgi:hypothetical protein